MISIVKAQKLVDELSEYFEVEKPIVKFARADSRRSWYIVKTNEIHLSKKTADMDSVLHEFSHAFVKDRGVRIGHGEYFVRVLSWIAEYYYGNSDKYPWRWEYKKVNKIYREIKDKI